jgi:hypothetical protein
VLVVGAELWGAASWPWAGDIVAAEAKRGNGAQAGISRKGTDARQSAREGLCAIGLIPVTS